MLKQIIERNEIILFENQGVKLEVNLKDETVWLNLEQMSELFSRDKSVISRYIKNASAEELKQIRYIKGNCRIQSIRKRCNY